MMAFCTITEMKQKVFECRLHVNAIMKEMCHLLKHYEDRLEDIDLEVTHALKEKGVEPIY